jgi:tetratricopeptide (TPR) repeat protein
VATTSLTAAIGDWRCRRPAEKEKIDAFIEGSVGYEALDKVVGAAVAAGCMCGLQISAKRDPSYINIAARVGVQAIDLEDDQLQEFFDQHQSPGDVRKIDLQQCKRITCIHGLNRFSQLEKLDLSGCNRVATESLAVVAKARTKLEFGNKSSWIVHALTSLGRLDEAIEQCHEDAQRPGDCAGECNAYDSIGDALGELGQLTEAIDYRNKALQIARDITDGSREGYILMNIVICLNRLQRSEGAIEVFKKSLEIGLRLRDRRMESKAIGNIGTGLSIQS